jgi:hypothetical protein
MHNPTTTQPKDTATAIHATKPADSCCFHRTFRIRLDLFLYMLQRLHREHRRTAVARIGCKLPAKGWQCHPYSKSASYLSSQLTMFQHLQTNAPCCKPRLMQLLRVPGSNHAPA